MHITILALGSRGDVQPYAALGSGFKAAGHQVRLISFEGFASLVAEDGLDFYPIHGDAQSLVATAGANTLALARSFGSLAEGYAKDLSAPLLGETDLLINQLPVGLYGFDLAEKYTIPMALAAVFPLTRTTALPLMGFPKLRLRSYNKATYYLGGMLVWQMFRPVINRWRKQTLDLPPLPWNGYLERLEQIPSLNGFSQYTVARPADWQEHVHVTGYWFPENRQWEPPRDLAEFIKSGSPPIFIGFGSMPIKDAKRTTELILGALEQTGQRAILHVGWGGLGNLSLPRSVFRIEYAPYDWLFPKMSMVIHHGGSGTTAFGLRAGVPSCAIPFVFDQFYWGERIAQLGVGPAPVPFKKLTVKRLRDAIQVAVNGPEIKQNAALLGEKIRKENGIENVLGILEQIVPPKSKK